MLLRLLALCCLSIGACTHAYVPNEYPLTRERLPGLRVIGPISIVNVQRRNEQELLFAMGVHKWTGDEREITQHYAQQLGKSLQQLVVQNVAGAVPKKLNVSVTSISAWAGFYHFKAKVVLDVTTGDGQRFDIVANNGSPGNIYRTLNGALAIAVLETLKHPGVQAYVTRPIVTASAVVAPAPPSPSPSQAAMPTWAPAPQL